MLVYAQGTRFGGTSTAKNAPANARVGYRPSPGLSYEARTLTAPNGMYLKARPALWTDESEAATEAPVEVEAAAGRTAEAYTKDDIENDYSSGYLIAEHLETPGSSDLYL